MKLRTIIKETTMKKLICILFLAAIIVSGCEFYDYDNPFISPIVTPKQLVCEYDWLTGTVCEYK